MRNDRKLFFAWSIFFAITILFIAAVEIFHNAKKDHPSTFQYRILIDKNSIIENEEKNFDTIHPEEKKVDMDAELYERTNYGYLPKISKDGVCVFDQYSARSETGLKKELRVAVFVDDASKIEAIKKLNNQKITFVVPHYIDNVKNIIKIIRESGHEFFIQMPTQSSIPDDKKGTVSPFLANADVDTTLDKLFYLLASAKYAVGLANTSPTLITKSKKDMTAIADVLAQRGLAFFDFEKSNDLLAEVAQKNCLLYICVTNTFESEGFDISKLKDGDVLAIRLTHLEDFTKNLSADWLLTPVSASVRK
jgi:hypothetical protein